MQRKVLRPKSLADPKPRFSQGILAGKTIYISGQISVDKEWNVIGKGDIEAQTHQIFRSIRAILKEAGGSLDNLVATTCYLTDIKYREGYNRVRRQYYANNPCPPTSTAVIVKGLAIKGCVIEVSGVAVL